MDNSYTMKSNRRINVVEFETYSKNNLKDLPSTESPRTPDIYQSLENPSQINTYSELKINKKFTKQDSENKSKSYKQTMTRPVVNKLANYPKQHRNSIDSSGSNRYLYSKTSKLNKISIDSELNDGGEESESHALDFKYDNRLSQSKGASQTMNFQNSSYLAYSLNSFHSSTREMPRDDAKTASSKTINIPAKLNESSQSKKSLVKLIKIKPSNLNKNPVRPRHSLVVKKAPIKEFKYCVLTDLKIGEGEFSELFQAFRTDSDVPTKIAAKKLKIGNENQNSVNILSGKCFSLIYFSAFFIEDIIICKFFWSRAALVF